MGLLFLFFFISEKYNIQISDVKLTVQYLEEWRMIFKMLRTSPYCEAVAPFAVASIG